MVDFEPARLIPLSIGYSVDNRWLVPHFEKMLYDNALLLRLYLEAWQVTKQRLFEKVVRDTLAYVRREMLHPEGSFYSTQDADSEGEALPR